MVFFFWHIKEISLLTSECVNAVEDWTYIAQGEKTKSMSNWMLENELLLITINSPSCVYKLQITTRTNSNENSIIHVFVGITQQITFLKKLTHTPA